MRRTRVKLGIVTPALTLLPGAHARWEEDAGIADVVAIAEAADALGVHHLTCSEHVAVPAPAAAVRGARYWDPLSTFGYLAARTRRIRLATHVLVLGYHHPLEIAKRYGTLDRICEGRLVLGVGVGSLEEEFALLDAPFADRGARADDALRALRMSFGRREPEFAGEHYRYGGFVVEPHGVQTDVPLWIGGRTARSLRRAVELGDGWVPFGLRSGELAAMLDRARASDAWSARARPLDVIVQNERPFDPLGEPDRVAEQLGRFTEIGATGVNLRFVHHSRHHYVEQLTAAIALAH